MTDKSNLENGMLRVLVPGNLLSTNADRFLSSALDMMDAQSRDDAAWVGMEIDFTRAQMVDSAGLNALIAVIRKLKSAGRRTSIRVHDAHVHRIFLFTRLDRQAEIVRI